MAEEACFLDIPGEPPFYQYGYDNSRGCWLTNYILFSFALVYVGILWRQAAEHWDDYKDIETLREQINARAIHIRGFIVGKYIFLATSVVVAGFVHHGLFGPAGYVDSGVNWNLWLIVEFTLVMAGGFTTCAAFSLLLPYYKVDFRKHYILYASILSFGCLLSFAVVANFGTDAFALSGALGEFLPDLLLLTFLVSLRVKACRLYIHAHVKDNAAFAGHNIAECQRGVSWCIAGIVIIFTGALVQVGLGASCGTRCPVDCPLPAPAFDHNALFHVLQTIGMGLMARGCYLICEGLESCVHERGYMGAGTAEYLISRRSLSKSSCGSAAPSTAAASCATCFTAA